MIEYFKDPEVAAVFLAEVGYFPAGQSRLTAPSNNNAHDDEPKHAVRHGVYRRPATSSNRRSWIEEDTNPSVRHRESAGGGLGR